MFSCHNTEKPCKIYISSGTCMFTISSNIDYKTLLFYHEMCTKLKPKNSVLI